MIEIVDGSGVSSTLGNQFTDIHSNNIKVTKNVMQTGEPTDVNGSQNVFKQVGNKSSDEHFELLTTDISKFNEDQEKEKCRMNFLQDRKDKSTCRIICLSFLCCNWTFKVYDLKRKWNDSSAPWWKKTWSVVYTTERSSKNLKQPRSDGTKYSRRLLNQGRHQKKNLKCILK